MLGDSHVLDSSQIAGNIATLLGETAKELSHFLEGALPESGPNWWEVCVLRALDPRQQADVKRRAVSDLARLDLAGLLRVLDQNWYAISRMRNLSAEERNFAKEMQTVRNRWAHVPAIPPERDDVYRDLDTIQRFVAAIGGGVALLERIKDAKKDLLRPSGSPAQTAYERQPNGSDQPLATKQPHPSPGNRAMDVGARPAQTWGDIKASIRADLLSRDLKDPRIRLRALDSLEQLLSACYPGFPADLGVLRDVPKDQIISRLEARKRTGRLNGAEQSVFGQVVTSMRQHPGQPSGDAARMERHLRTSPPARPLGPVGLLKRGLPPVADDSSRILILGTIPGDESLSLQQYYAHPRNQFWEILGDVYAEPIGSSYEERILFLRRKGLALWDVLQSAARKGSLDSSLVNETPNDFTGFFRSYPGLQAVAFNGARAARMFQKYVAVNADTPLMAIEGTVLPSTSPTPGKNVLSYDGKLAKWREFLL